MKFLDLELPSQPTPSGFPELTSLTIRVFPLTVCFLSWSHSRSAGTNSCLLVWYPKPTSYVIPGPKPYEASILGDPGNGPKVPSTVPTGGGSYPYTNGTGTYPYTKGTGTYPVPTDPSKKEGTEVEHDEQLKDPKVEHDEQAEDPETEHVEQPKRKGPKAGYVEQPRRKGPKVGYVEQPKRKGPKVGYLEQPEDKQTVVTVSKTVTVTVTATSKCAPARRFRGSR